MTPRQAWPFGGCSSLAIVVVLAATPCLANAETLAEALALAYQSNPTLQQARAQQRALDETSVQARTGLRPTVGVTASDNYEKVYGANIPGVNTGGATLSITQPLFTSGKVSAAIRSADASVYAGRENLRATEISVLLAVVQSYEDVLRDQTVQRIREDDVNALIRVRDEIVARREVGTITKTDVLQIQSQFDTARANLAAARAQLQNSRAAYAALVGQNPGDLTPPTQLPGIPADVDQAFDAAEQDNPLLRAATLTEKASHEKIAEAKAGFGPTVAVGAQYGYSGTNTPVQTTDFSRAFTAQLTVTQPLFTGGLTSSVARQSIELNAADRVGIERMRRQVVQSVAQAWNQMLSSQKMLEAHGSARDAAKLELEGMQEEYKAGLRTTLEVLSADEGARQAELNYAIAEHDGYLAEANLLGAMGRLEAASIIDGAPLYDPERHFERVKSKGAVPYSGLLTKLDSLGSVRAGRVKPIEAPRTPSQTPTMVVATTAPAADAPLAEHSRVVVPIKILPKEGADVRKPRAPGPAYVVQIGAYPTAALAEQGWRDTDATMLGRMANKTKSIEPVAQKDQTFYRLLVGGFVDSSSAGSFCKELKSKHVDCWVKKK